MSFLTLSFLVLFLPLYLLIVVSFRGRLRESILCVLSGVFLFSLSAAVFFICFFISLCTYLFARHGLKSRCTGVTVIVTLAAVATLLKMFLGNSFAQWMDPSLAAVTGFGVLCAVSVSTMLNCSYLYEVTRGGPVETRLIAYLSYTLCLPLLFTGPSLNYEEYRAVRAEPEKQSYLDGLLQIMKGVVKAVAVGFSCLQGLSGVVGFLPDGLDVASFLVSILLCAFGACFLLYGIGDIAVGLGKLQGLLILAPFDRKTIFSGIRPFAFRFNRATALFSRRYLTAPLNLSDAESGVAAILLLSFQYFSTSVGLLWGLLLGGLYLLEQALIGGRKLLRVVRPFYAMPILAFSALFLSFFSISDLSALFQATFLTGSIQAVSSKTLFTLTQYGIPMLFALIGLTPKFSLSEAKRVPGPAARLYCLVGWGCITLLFIYSLFNLLNSDANLFSILWQGVAR